MRRSRCEGRLVFPDAETLQAAVTTYPRIRSVVLDLAEIKAVDDAGLGLLVSLRAWAKTTGTTLKLMNLNPKVVYLLELTHLLPLFEICSVKDMFELLCGAFQQSRFAEREAASEIPVGVLGDTGPISTGTQW